MEKEFKAGSVADFDLKVSGGKVSFTAEVPVAGLTNVTTLDVGVLVDKLFAEIEAKSPAGAVPIEEGAKLILKNALLAL